MTTFHTKLDHRGAIRVAGPDSRTFLQGLISNDINRVTPDTAIHSAFLTAQGKFLHEFFICQQGDDLIFDCEAERAADLVKRLSMYKLRAKASVEIAPELGVAAVFGDDPAGALGLAETPGASRPCETGVAFMDPRLAVAGARVLLPRESMKQTLDGLDLTPSDADTYDGHRIGLGLPDGSRDMIVDKAILLENGFAELNGVDWDKGCFVGQELTARTKYRGLIKKRLLPVLIDGPTPPPGTPVLLEGKDAGEMRSAQKGRGLALLRLEKIAENPALEAAGAKLTLAVPDWVELPEA
ncbi:MAG: YgfZ/GcvT domain-containing protein [Magnetospiraceae bacterium]